MSTPVSTRHYLSAELAAELRLARLRRGLGLRELALKAGIPPGHLSMLEHGQRCPSLALAQDWAAALGLDAELAARLFAEARPDAGRSWRPRS